MNLRCPDSYSLEFLYNIWKSLIIFLMELLSYDNTEMCPLLGKNKKTYLEVIHIGKDVLFESPREIDRIGNILVGI